MLQQVSHHEPVMLEEVLQYLQPRSGGVYADGTAGGGGHARAVLEASSPEGRLLALDRDAAAVGRVQQVLEPYGRRVTVVHARFRELPEVMERTGIGPLDGLLVDLGVSSVQLDDPARGLSFMHSGPLGHAAGPQSRGDGGRADGSFERE